MIQTQYSILLILHWPISPIVLFFWTLNKIGANVIEALSDSQRIYMITIRTHGNQHLTSLFKQQNVFPSDQNLGLRRDLFLFLRVLKLDEVKLISRNTITSMCALGRLAVECHIIYDRRPLGSAKAGAGHTLVAEECEATTVCQGNGVISSPRPDKKIGTGILTFE